MTGAKKRDDDVWHAIEQGSELPAIDTKVVAELDWDRRHQLRLDRRAGMARLPGGS